MRFPLLDILLIALLLGAATLGMRAGPLRKTITCAGLLVALALAFRLMGPLGGLMIRTGWIAPRIAMAAAFIVTTLAVSAIPWLLLRRFGKKAAPGIAGKISGALVGLVEGAFALSALLLVLKFFDAPSPSAREGSLLYRPMVNLAPRAFDALRAFFPEEEELNDGFTGEEERK